MALPSSIVPLYIKLIRGNRPFVSEEGAHERIADRRVRPMSWAPPAKLPYDVTIDAERRGAWPVYTVRPSRGETHGAVIYVHGGGWVNEIVKQHWHLIAQIAADSNTTVIVPIYPLVPWGTAAAARDTIMQLAFDAIDQYGQVCLAGDSAGGQISLSVALALRDRGVTIPHTALISPALDLTWSNPRIPEVQPSDPWLAVPGGRVLADAWRGDLDITDPAVSPLFGDFRGLGGISIYSGTRDVLNPDAHVLLDKLHQAGVTAELHEQPGQLHVYPLLPTKVGEAARARITADLRDAMLHAKESASLD